MAADCLEQRQGVCHRSPFLILPIKESKRQRCGQESQEIEGVRSAHCPVEPVPSGWPKARRAGDGDYSVVACGADAPSPSSMSAKLSSAPYSIGS